eukprot:SAG31_NODE_18118_length_646_cov_1.073126_2_plen_26_part_01
MCVYTHTHLANFFSAVYTAVDLNLAS